MKRVENIQQLKSEFSRVHSGVAADTIFGAKALMFIAEKLDNFIKGETNATRKRVVKRNASIRGITGNSKGQKSIPRTNDEKSVEVHQEAQITGQER